MTEIKRGMGTAAVFCGSVIGAGFATGRELTVYFAKYGLCGFWGIIIFIILSAVFIYKILLLPPIFNGRIISAIVFLFNLAVCSAMLAAADEMLPCGGAVTAVLTFAAVCGGLRLITDISRVLMPVMLFVMIISAICITEKIHFEYGFNAAFLPSSAIYAAYNILTPSVLFDKVQTDKKTALTAAAASGIMLTIAAAAIMLPIYSHYQHIYMLSLPIYELCSKYGIAPLYCALIIPALFTTAVSSCAGAAEYIKIKNKYICGGLCIISALALSLFGFSNIVGRLYFAFGVMGLLPLALVLFKKH